MTVQELREALKEYPGDAHVCLAIYGYAHQCPTCRSPDDIPNRKREIFGVKRDRARVVNIMSGSSACEIDSDLRLEKGEIGTSKANSKKNSIPASEASDTVDQSAPPAPAAPAPQVNGCDI